MLLPASIAIGAADPQRVRHDHCQLRCPHFLLLSNAGGNH